MNGVMNAGRGLKLDVPITQLRENGICLELCPTVNLVTRAIPDYACSPNL